MAVAKRHWDEFGKSLVFVKDCRPMADAAKELQAMQTALTALEGLEPEGRERALNWLASALGAELQIDSSRDGAGFERGDDGGTNREGAGSQADPKSFMADKQPETDIERVTCLGYYISKYRNQRVFKTADLTELNVEAAGRAIGNPAQAVDNATRKSGYLASAGKGLRQVTRVGEEVVEALPDRDKVKSIMAKAPKRRKPRGKKAR
ncbi:MAG: hypothetical protein AB7V58_11705 [Solirubrobacterales bacterium]